MLGKVMGRFWIGRSRRTARGSVMPIFAVMSLPVLMSVGVGVDMTRMTLARSALQSAVDGAALAAAAAGGYSKSAGSVADTNATNAAKNYFSGNYTHGGQGPSVTSAGASIVPTVTPPLATSSGYKVTVSAQGTMNTVLVGMAKLIGGGTSNASINSVVIQAYATANNTTTPGTGPKLVVKANNVGSTAADWNAAYIYAVPFLPDGVTPDYEKIPQASDLYLAGSNCPPESYDSTLYCYYGAAQNCSPTDAHPDLTDFPNSNLDLPIAMVFINVTNGRKATSVVTDDQGSGYGSGPTSNMNFYGARFGSCQVFMTALISAGKSPSTYADSVGQTKNTSAFILNKITGGGVAKARPIHPQTTHYSDVTNDTLSNCLLLVQNIDPNAVPTAPPTAAPGKCFSVTDTKDTISGKEYANLSCNQMAGRTFMYWFNDMGWYPADDKDYQNLSFTFRCTPTSSSNTSGTVTTPVSLMK